MKRKLLFLSALLSVVCLCIACTPNGVEHDTATETVEETESIAATERETESETETEIETETETETEMETDAPYTVSSMTIAGEDLSRFRVVVSRNVLDGHVTTAHAFVQHVKAATGIELPIVTDVEDPSGHEIVIGDTNRATSATKAAVKEIVDDGYAIVEDGGNLFIVASTGRGVVYGVSDFLEKYMGVRFYTPTETYYRETGAVALESGMKDVFSPMIYARRTWADSLVGSQKIEFLIYKNNSGGLSKFKVGDTIDISANSNHTIDNLAKVDGEALVPCMCDEKVYQTVLANVLKSLQKNSDVNAIQVGQGDGGTPCKCSKCTAVNNEYGTDNAAWFLFINRLADEVAEQYPGVKIITYSYQFTHGVPQNGYTVSDNVIINFCFDKACYNHAFDDPNCEKNVPVVAEFREWAALCKAGNLYVYEYAWNCGSAPLPDPNPFVMWDNFQLFVECGVNGILAEGIPSKGGEMDYLRHYLRTKLAWNPYMTEEEYYTLMDEFMEDYYGDAAPILKQYWETLYDPEYMHHSDMYTPKEAFYRNLDENGKRDVTFATEMMELWNSALAVETLTPEQYEHVEYGSMHMIWIMRQLVFDRKMEKLWNRLVDKYGLIAT